MRSISFKMLCVVAAAVLLCGFGAIKNQAMASNFEPVKLGVGDYLPKVDGFVVILDASLSMGDMYDGRQKLDIAKDIVSRMNQTLPELNYKAGLRTFGQGKCLPKGSSSLIYGIDAYSTEGLEKALEGVICAGGNTPLESGEKGALNDLKDEAGKVAIIIVSDGIVVDSLPISAAMAVKEHFGERVCIYTVQVGASPKGRGLLKKIADVGACGFATDAASIASAEAMAEFVEKVFLDKAPAKPGDRDGDGVIDEKDRCPDTPRGVKVDARGCPLDTDGDGVPDYQDKCPGTPAGVKVDMNGCPPEAGAVDSDGDGVVDAQDQCPQTPKGASVDNRGCWAYMGVLLFDFDKYNIKPEAHPALNEAFKVFEMNPSLRVQVNGHTDSKGSEAYNQTLSEKRAKAVMDYLAEKGIDSSRLKAVGMGESKPVASNDTKEGRAKNRRVEFSHMP